MQLVRWGALTTVAALALGGCGDIKERKERADRIIESVDRAVAAETAQMAVSTEVRIKLEALPAAGAAQPGGTAPKATVNAQADLALDRVAFLAVDAAGAPEAVRIYSGTTIYARRLTQAAATTQRPWVRLDLTSIDPDEIDDGDIEVADALRKIQETRGFDNPLFLLKLLRGSLAGSVEEVGKDEVLGVSARHYRLNIDREKAVKDEDEAVQDAYEALFKSIFATSTVFPAEVWLDDQGLPRRYAVTLKSSVRRRALADIRLTVELFDVGQPVQIVLPGKDETAKVDDLGSLAQAVTGGA